MTPARIAKFKQVLDHRQPDLTLIADQVNKPQNLSALIRTADAVGIHRVHAVVPREGYRDYRGTARGSGQWVEVVSHPDNHSALDAVGAQGMQLVVAHWSERAVDYRQIDYTRPTALLMGAEMQGVSEQAARRADHHVLVPMMGMVGSLNVSVAAGIILAEARQQRADAGLYDHCRLDAAEYRRTLFRWIHPQLADYCVRKGIDFPPLDDAGELVEPFVG
ncbi:tRNA (guanosine(18)-2'-O)-methyltransferase TrmH [Motiliproteus sediminis]|uniref:tRNA (guanosine(18)-2'-O)-methyltransferase TrmH n=1 Tax=Motiliproteus sediminis TaxID=1468178 RepID=UPI001AF0073C|nr:tRNA (guanosine(18)-2'-O)-methyltransferase TrmH [Motiliproteus sediminis]